MNNNNNNRGQNNRGRRRNNNSNNNNRGGNNRGGADSANRIDSRARGNAAQMLEKYKKMAQDAHTNDDGVNSEYYWQFADHYFRVLADTKARQDEERAKREAEREQGGNNNQHNNRGNRNDRNDRDDNDDGQDSRGHKSDNKNDDDNISDDKPKRRVNTRRPKQDAGDDTPQSDDKPKRAPRARKAPVAKDKSGDDNQASMDLAALPPAIGGDDVAAVKPKIRRARTPKADKDETPVAAE